MKSKYLVELNLPKYFSFFDSTEFVHVIDINPQWSDKENWSFALTNNLLILTKDADFYLKAIDNNPIPKIIYFKLGNMALRQLHKYFIVNWRKLIEFTLRYSFVIA